MTSDIHAQCKLYREFYTYELKNAPKNHRYVFGDNLERVGTGGQAVIRRFPCAFGIATKVSPGMHPQDFFHDAIPEHKEAIDADIEALRLEIQNDPTLEVFFPVYGLGTGLSQMIIRCPQLYKHMNQRIKEVFGIEFPKI